MNANYDSPYLWMKPEKKGGNPRFHGTMDVVHQQMKPDWDAVFWDIGGVILDTESVRSAHRQFISDVLAEHDVAVAVDEALETWRNELGTYFRERLGTNYRPARRGYDRAIDAIIKDVPDDAWRPHLDRAFRVHLSPNPNTRSTLATLADQDLHLGVISDIDSDEGRQILELFGVREHFDAITTSEEVGRTKPDPAMFETALEKAGVEPHRSLMVGDRYTHDMEGAARHGITTVAYTAADGPAVDYTVTDLQEVVEIVDSKSLPKE